MITKIFLNSLKHVCYLTQVAIHFWELDNCAAKLSSFKNMEPHPKIESKIPYHCFTQEALTHFCWKTGCPDVLLSGFFSITFFFNLNHSFKESSSFSGREIIMRDPKLLSISSKNFSICPLKITDCNLFPLRGAEPQPQSIWLGQYQVTIALREEAVMHSYTRHCCDLCFIVSSRRDGENHR